MKTVLPDQVGAAFARQRAEVLRVALALSNPERAPAIDFAGVDVNAVVRRAHLLGTSNAVIWSLERAGLAGRLSKTDLDYASEQLSKSMLLLHEASLAVEALHAAGVGVLALKGFAFALSLYREHPEVRGMADVDLLVDQPTFRAVEKALLPLGWVAQRERPVTSRLSIELSFAKEVPSDPPLPISLDVHRRLTTPLRFTIDHRALWRRSVRGEGRVPGLLDPVDSLLHLAVHKAQEGHRNQARDLVDAVNIVALGIDWDAFVRRAQQWRASGAAWLFLSRACDALDADVPKRVLDHLRPGRARRALFRRLFPAATHPDFVRILNRDRPLGAKVAAALVINDSPALEALALGAISVRNAADLVVSTVPSLSPACSLLERVPL